MSEQKRVIYTKEELAAKVKVPAIVEQDLKRIISDRLEQCGLYYRCFSRIKTASSMAHKFALKDYGAENKKLQDLVGVRINLYFDDDVEICQNIVENWLVHFGKKRGGVQTYEIKRRVPSSGIFAIRNFNRDLGYVY